MWMILRTFLSANGLLVALIVAGGALLWSYDSSRVNHGRDIERAQTHKANAKAAKVATRVRVKSRSKGVRGIRDPYTID